MLLKSAECSEISEMTFIICFRETNDTHQVHSGLIPCHTLFHIARASRLACSLALRAAASFSERVLFDDGIAGGLVPESFPAAPLVVGSSHMSMGTQATKNKHNCRKNDRVGQSRRLGQPWHPQLRIPPQNLRTCAYRTTAISLTS